MILFRFSPIGLRFVRRIVGCNQLITLLNPNRWFQKYNKLILLKITTLAFIWPVKDCSEANPKIKLSFIKDVDDLFENGHYDQCYKILTLCKNGDDVEIQWRLCRVLYNIAKESKSDDINNKKDLITRAYYIISEQLKSNYENFYVQKWYALLLDAKSANDGIKERIRNLENVKKHMDIAVTLNPKDATTLFMLGEWCYQLAEMPWHQRKIAAALFASPPTSTYEDALGYFLRAESAEPRFYSLNLLRIGNCYLKLKKEDQANYYLKLAASYPAKSNDDHQANKEASELLNKYLKKYINDKTKVTSDQF